MLNLKMKTLLLTQALIFSLSGCIQAPKGEAEITSNNPDVIKALRKKNPSPAVVGNWSGKVGTFINYSTINLDWTPSTFANLEKHVLNVYAGSSCTGPVTTYDVFDPNAESYSITLADGVYSYNVTVNFDGGKVATTACSGDLYVDTLNPVGGTVSSSIPNQSSNIITVNYSGGSDTFFLKNSLRICSGTASCSDDANCTSNVDDSVGTSSVDITVSGDGSYMACLNTYDQAGNESGWSSSNIFLVDSATPIPQITISKTVGNVNPTVVVSNLDPNGGSIYFSKLSDCGTIFDDGYSEQGDNDGYNYAAGVSSITQEIHELSTDGTHTFYAKQVDIQSNFQCSSSSPVNGSVDYTFDTQVPTVSSVSIKNGDAYTNSNSVSVVLSASDTGSGISAICLSEDANVNNCTSWRDISSNTSTQDIILSSGDGIKTAYIFAKDKAGNISNASSDTITLDTSAPTLSLVLPDYINQGNETSVTVTGACSDSEAGQTVTLKYNGTAIGTSTCSSAPSSTYSISFDSSSSGIADGTSLSFTAYLADVAGNLTSVSDSLTKDTVAPAAATGLGWTQSSPTKSTTIQAAWTPNTDATSQSIAFYSDGSCSAAEGTTAVLSSTDNSKSFTPAGGEGTYSYKITNSDAYGNTSSVCSSAITIDSTAPTVSMTASGSYINLANKTSFAISGSCDEAASLVKLYVNGSDVGAEQSGGTCSGSSYSLTWDARARSDGSYSLMVKLSDGAGNVGSTSPIAVTKDTVAPNVTIEQSPAFSHISCSVAVAQADPTNSSIIDYKVFFYDVIDPSTFSASDIQNDGGSGSLTWNITDCGDNQTFLLSTSSISGDGTIKPSLAASKVTDAAGNGNTASTSVDNEVTYDTVAPTISSINRYLPSSEVTDSTTVIFKMALSEALGTAPTTADFNVAMTGTVTKSSMSITASGTSEYDITIGGVAGDGELKLEYISSVADNASNSTDYSAANFISETFIINNNPVALTSITRSAPSTEKTNSMTLSFQVDFDGDVASLSTQDFNLEFTSAQDCSGAVVDGAITSVTANGSSASYIVTANLNSGSIAVFDDVYLSFNDEASVDVTSVNTGLKISTSSFDSGTALYQVNSCPPSIQNVAIGGDKTVSGSSDYYNAGDTLALQITYDRPLSFDTAHSLVTTITSGTLGLSNSVLNTLQASYTYNVTVAASTYTNANNDLVISGYTGSPIVADEYGNSFSISDIVYSNSTQYVPIDSYPPSHGSYGMTKVIPYYFDRSLSVSVDSAANDNGSGINYYELAVIESAGGSVIVSAHSIPASSSPSVLMVPESVFSGLGQDLEPNSDYEIRIVVVDKAGNENTYASFSWKTPAICGQSQASSCYDNYTNTTASLTHRWSESALQNGLAVNPEKEGDGWIFKDISGDSFKTSIALTNGIWVRDLNNNNEADVSEYSNPQNWMRSDGVALPSRVGSGLSIGDIDGRAEIGLYYTMSQGLVDFSSLAPTANIAHNKLRNPPHCHFANIAAKDSSIGCNALGMRLPILRETQVSIPGTDHLNDSCSYVAAKPYSGIKGVPGFSTANMWSATASLSDRRAHYPTSTSYFATSPSKTLLNQDASTSSGYRCVSNYSEVSLNLEDNYFSTTVSLETMVIDVSAFDSQGLSVRRMAQTDIFENITISQNVLYQCFYDFSLDGFVGPENPCETGSLDGITFNDEKGLFKLSPISNSAREIEVIVKAVDRNDVSKVFDSKVFYIHSEVKGDYDFFCTGQGIKFDDSCYEISESIVDGLSVVYTRGGKKLLATSAAVSGFDGSGPAAKAAGVEVLRSYYPKTIAPGKSYFPFLAADGKDRWSEMSPMTYHELEGRARVGLFYTFPFASVKLSDSSSGALDTFMNYSENSTFSYSDLACNFVNLNSVGNSPCRNMGMWLPTIDDLGMGLSVGSSNDSCNYDGSKLTYGSNYGNYEITDFVPAYGSTTDQKIWTSSLATLNDSVYVFSQGTQWTFGFSSSQHAFRCVAR